MTAVPNEELLRRFDEDEEFRARISAAETLEEAVLIAREHGIEVTVANPGAGAGPLSEDELDRVSGGFAMSPEGVTPLNALSLGC